MKLSHFFFASLFLSSLSCFGEDSVTAPRPAPLTRPEMKRLLEDMKAIAGLDTGSGLFDLDDYRNAVRMCSLKLHD